MSYVGHIMRNTSGHYDTLLRTIEGRLEGKEGGGRQRRTWVDDLRDWTGSKTYMGHLQARTVDATLNESWKTWPKTICTWCNRHTLGCGKIWGKCSWRIMLTISWAYYMRIKTMGRLRTTLIDGEYNARWRGKRVEWIVLKIVLKMRITKLWCWAKW